MKERLVATRYAKALLAALPDAAAVERANDFLAEFAAALEASADLLDVLLNPAVPRPARKAVLQAMAKERGAPQILSNFLAVVADHRRAGALAEIADAFSTLKDKSLGVVPATLTTAKPVGDDVAARAQGVLEKITGLTVRLTREVDPSLLGGAVARIGSTVYDGSVSTQLGALGRRMAEE